MEGIAASSPLNSIEAYIQFTPGLITDDGDVTNDSVGKLPVTTALSSMGSSLGCTRYCIEVFRLEIRATLTETHGEAHRLSVSF
jgi:hypothetical protein